MLYQVLTAQNYQVIIANTLHVAEYELQKKVPDLLILDWMLPDGDGVNWLSNIKKVPRFSHLLALILTAKSTEDDIVNALSKGADDYLKKPFSFKELLARLDALWRRANSHPAHKQASSNLLEPPKKLIEQDGFVLDVTQRSLHLSPSLSNTSVGTRLSNTEFQLLFLLMSHPSRVFERPFLLSTLNATDVEERTIDAHMLRLRKKLKSLHPEADLIQTVRGLGYVWKTDLSSPTPK
jgi:two-component system phosphate regulon response regulator PhoB